MTSNINGIIDNIRKAIQHSTQGMIGREQLAELVVLAAVAHEHLLVIGPQVQRKVPLSAEFLKHWAGVILNTFWGVLPNLQSYLVPLISKN